MAMKAVLLSAVALTFVGIICNTGVSGEKPCVLASSEDVLCVERRYPYPNSCGAYIQCNANCLSKIKICPRFQGLRTHFSSATQSCELPATVNCIDDTQQIPPIVPVALSPGHAVATPTEAPTRTPPSSIIQQQQSLTPTVFCALRKSDINGKSSPMNFDEVTVNEGAAFNLSYDTFIPKASGLYWFHFSVGLPEVYFTEVRISGLQTTGRVPSIRRTMNGYIDTTSRNELAQLTASSDMLIMETENMLVSDSLSVVTSWSGFHLDSVMNNVAAFSVSLSYAIWEDIRIPFDTLFVDTHLAWDNVLHEYVIPIAGTWVFALHCGDFPGYPNRGFTYLNISRHRLIEVAHQWSREGVDIDGTTVVVDVRAGDKVFAKIGYSPVYSDDTYLTSLMGFHYSPNNLPSVSWFVALITDYEGLQDPLAFPWVISNNGDGWSDVTNIFTPPADGVYYLTWTAFTPYNFYAARLDLIKNGIQTASVDCPNIDGNRSRTRAIILRLTTADQVWIRLPERNYVGGASTVALTVFAGFRLSP